MPDIHLAVPDDLLDTFKVAAAAERSVSQQLRALMKDFVSASLAAKEKSVKPLTISQAKAAVKAEASAAARSDFIAYYKQLLTGTHPNWLGQKQTPDHLLKQGANVDTLQQAIDELAAEDPDTPPEPPHTASPKPAKVVIDHALIDAINAVEADGGVVD